MAKVGEIQRVLLVGNLIVYHRVWSEAGLKKYVVFHATKGEAIQEFDRRETACRWAVSHSDWAIEALPGYDTASGSIHESPTSCQA